MDAPRINSTWIDVALYALVVLNGAITAYFGYRQTIGRARLERKLDDVRERSYRIRKTDVTNGGSDDNAGI